jgi:hypothetical protein
MTVQSFLIHVTYSTICPKGINPFRWRGMLKWYDTQGL